MSDPKTKASLEYRFSLDGPEIDLQLLSRFYPDASCRVAAVPTGGQDDKEWVLSSTEHLVFPENYSYRRVARAGKGSAYFDAQIDENLPSARTKAEWLLSRMHGAARIARRQYRGVRLSGVYTYDMRGKWRSTASIFAADPKRLYGLPTEQSGLPDLVRKWTIAGLSDPRVGDALEAFGINPVTWSSLYLVYELIEEECGQFMFKLISKKILEDFIFSAHNSRSYKDGTRHAKRGGVRRSKSRRMLTLVEGEMAIIALLNAWLGEKTGWVMR